MFSLFNNLRMVFKIGLIALMMGGVMIGLVSYMGSRMSSIDLAYADLVERIDANTTVLAQTARRGETYRAAAYALLTETTDAGNARLLKVTKDTSDQVLETLDKMKARVPEKATAIGQGMDRFSKAFTICAPIIDAASKTTTAEQNTKVAE